MIEKAKSLVGNWKPVLLEWQWVTSLPDGSKVAAIVWRGLSHDSNWAWRLFSKRSFCRTKTTLWSIPLGTVDDPAFHGFEPCIYKAKLAAEKAMLRWKQQIEDNHDY